MSDTSLLLLLGIITFLYGLCWYRVHGYRRYCKSRVSLHGKTAIVTGGNAGIGKATAIDLARRGARVIIACRNPTLAEKAVKEIRMRANSSNVDNRHHDLASLESVRSFCRRFLEVEPRLDILVNNAGLAKGPLSKKHQHTVDGFEMIFGVNHFGHFLLTLLLIDHLKKSSPSRIVMVASGAHKYVMSAMHFTPKSATDGKLSKRLRYLGLSGYCNSKAENIMFARELSRRLKDTGVTAYSLHPGVVYTSIMRKSSAAGPMIYYIICPFYWLLSTSERTGAQGIIHCAVDENVTHLSGSYFENCLPHQIRSWVVEDDALCKKLWEISCQAVGIENGH